MKKILTGTAVLGCLLLSACSLAGGNTMPTVGNIGGAQEEKTEATTKETTQRPPDTQALARSSALKKGFEGELTAQSKYKGKQGTFAMSESYVKFMPEEGEQTLIPLGDVLFIIQSASGVQFQTRSQTVEFPLPLEFVQQVREHFYLSRSESGRGYR